MLSSHINNIIVINAEGIDPSINSKCGWKLPYFIENHINTSNTFIPAIAMAESWLKPHISNAQIHIKNYQIVRADRKERDRGGALLFIHEDLPISNQATYDEFYCQAVICSIQSSNTVIACVYRPPNTPYESTTKLLNFLSGYVQKVSSKEHMDIIITGDLNLPGIDWNNLTVTGNDHKRSAHSLLSFMSEHLLSQYVDTPTRNDNILDLFLTNNSNLPLHVSAEDTKLSDHRLINVLTRQSLKPLPLNTKPTFQKHSFRNLRINKSNLSLISDQIDSVDWDNLHSLCTEDEFPELFRLTVLQICEIHCPPKSTKKRATKPRNKFARERRVLNRKRRKINKKLTECKDEVGTKPPNPQLIAKTEKQLNDIIEKIKNSIKSQLEFNEDKAVKSVSENPSYFFSYAKRFAKHPTNIGPLIDNKGNLQQHPKNMADMLQEQYSSVFSEPSGNSPDQPQQVTSILEDITFTQEDVISAIKEMGEYSASIDDDIPATVLKNCAPGLCYPIVLIWRDSLKSSSISKQFKNQTITPVFKKGSKSKAANYRPISLTSHIMKIFGRIVRKAIVNHLEQNQLICKHQHGFLKGRGCLTQLIKHIDTILHNFLNGNDTDAIYLDFSKAFDKVDHKILLKKLYAYGIRGNLLAWLECYLSNREQTVVVNGFKSNPAPVMSGVPQGTVLGPILFLIYINDLHQCINHSLVSHFADDTRILKAINISTDVALLQQDLLATVDWSQKNKMVLNPDKFELLNHTLRKSNTLQELPFYNQFQEYQTPDGTLITPTDIVTDLGINITPDLNWSPQINITAEKSRKLIAWVLSVFKDRSETTMMTLYKSLIRSRLEYCSALWNPSKQEDIITLESVQRNFTSRIAGLSDYSYHERLKRLNILSLQRRRERFIIITMWKILNNISPNDLNFKTTHSNRRGIKVKVPPLQKEASQRAQSLYEASFGVVGPKLWNTLPRYLTIITKKNTFKTNLSKYLATIPDRPPVDGISSHNSLLDINRLQVISSGGRAPAVAAAAVVPTTAAATSAEDYDDPHQAS